MTIERPTAQIILTDPQQELWNKKIELWMTSEINYEELMKYYPTYTINEKIQKFLSKIFPKFN